MVEDLLGDVAGDTRNVPSLAESLHRLQVYMRVESALGSHVGEEVVQEAVVRFQLLKDFDFFILKAAFTECVETQILGIASKCLHQILLFLL